jgi:hypothetical protein
MQKMGKQVSARTDRTAAEKRRYPNAVEETEVVVLGDLEEGMGSAVCFPETQNVLARTPVSSKHR